MRQPQTDVVVRLSLLGMLGGLIGTIGAIVTQFAMPAVSAGMTSYPYAARTFILTEVLWTAAHALALAGFVGFARSGLAGSTRSARVGIGLATVGLALMIPLEFGYVLAAGTLETDLYPTTLSCLFGPATVFVALGMMLAGVATLRAGRWGGWRRFIPLACGVYTVALMGLMFTPVHALSIAGFFFLFLVLSFAVATRLAPMTPSLETARAWAD